MQKQLSPFRFVLKLAFVSLSFVTSNAHAQFLAPGAAPYVPVGIPTQYMTTSSSKPKNNNAAMILGLGSQLCGALGAKLGANAASDAFGNELLNEARYSLGDEYDNEIDSEVRRYAHGNMPSAFGNKEVCQDFTDKDGNTGKWGKQFYSYMREPIQGKEDLTLEDVIVNSHFKDADQFCPNINSFSPALRKAYAAYIPAALSHPESSCNARAQNPTVYIAGAGHATGLFQFGPKDCQNVGMGVLTYEQLKDPAVSIECMSRKLGKELAGRSAPRSTNYQGPTLRDPSSDEPAGGYTDNKLEVSLFAPCSPKGRGQWKCPPGFAGTHWGPFRTDYGNPDGGQGHQNDLKANRELRAKLKAFKGCEGPIPEFPSKAPAEGEAGL